MRHTRLHRDGRRQVRRERPGPRHRAGYVRQLIAQARAGDGLIGISTSGNSDNLVRAFIKAKEMGVTTVGLAGMSGGEMSKIGLDHCLVVETDSIHRVQECHVIIYHILWDLVHTLLADNRGSLAVMG